MSKNIKSTAELSLPEAYEIEYSESLPDVDSLGIVLRHKKSGARICLISNDDENKVFYIGFRTPVTDDTGVPHIIEHTVLCGSDRYPCRDPFMLLAKGSLNTFLNAMTYPDKTVYPVASCNDHDFANLMSVYMDAVFHPNIYKYREIFMQEGWHYELERPEDELKVNGIVYNEMKGVLSSPDSQVFDELCKVLYPDTTYGRSSGGDPECIPSLTYEQYLDFHRTHYHPSNSYIYLWGDCDLEERLEWMDKNYLSHYDAIDVSGTEITEQKPFGGLHRERAYFSVEPGSAQGERDERSYLVYAAVTCPSGDPLECIAWDIIGEVLIGTTGAPIRTALLEAGIGADILAGVLDHIRQSGIFIMAKNACAEDGEKFLSIVRDGLRKAAGGMDKDALRAALNSREFAYREADFGSTPKGLCYGLDLLQSWLYDDSSALRYMHLGDCYAKLRDGIDNGYFESLIEKAADPQHAVMLSYEPREGLIGEVEARLAAKLADFKASLGEEELRGIVAETERLREYQERPSTPEESQCIPVLSRSDIRREPLPYSNIECTVGGVRAVEHEGQTAGIEYITLYFDISELPQQWLPHISELCGLCGRMDTAHHSYAQLTTEIKLNIGKLSLSESSYLKEGESDSFSTYASVEISCLEGKVREALALVREILTETDYSDTRRLRELLAESRSDVQSKIFSRGHSVASTRALSYFSRFYKLSDWNGGIGAYRMLEAELAALGERGGEIALTYERAARAAFDPERLTVSFCGGAVGRAALEESIPGMIEALRGYACPPDSDGCWFDGMEGDILAPCDLCEGFAMSSQVQFVAMAGNMREGGIRYRGSMKVLENAINNEYLYNAVRVRGGAYGVFCRINGAPGYVYFASFRDPRMTETEHVYLGAAEWARGLDPDEDTITRYIIGTFSGIDRPLSVREKAARSMANYLMGTDFERIRRERHEMIDTTAEQLREDAAAIAAATEHSFRCTLGNARVVREQGDFKNIVPLS